MAKRAIEMIQLSRALKLAEADTNGIVVTMFSFVCLLFRPKKVVAEHIISKWNCTGPSHHELQMPFSHAMNLFFVMRSTHRRRRQRRWQRHNFIGMPSTINSIPAIQSRFCSQTSSVLDEGNWRIFKCFVSCTLWTLRWDYSNDADVYDELNSNEYIKSWLSN